MPRLKDFNSVDELAQSPREFKVSLVGGLDSLVNHFGAEHREELYTKIVRCSPVFEHAVNVNLNGLMGCFFDYLANDLDDLVKQFGEDRKEELYTKIIRHSLFFEYALNFNLDGLMWHFGNHKEFLYDQVACRENGLILNGLATENLDGVMQHFGEDYKEDLYTKITGNNRVFINLVRYNLNGLMWHFWREHHKKGLFNKIINFDHFDFENIVSENLNGLMWHFGTKHKKDLFNKIINLYPVCFANIVSKNLDGVMRHFGDDEYKETLFENIIYSNYFGDFVRKNLDSLMRHFGDDEYKDTLFENIIYSNYFDDFVSNNLDGLVNNFFEYKDQLLEAIQKTLPRYEQACNEKIAQRQLEDFNSVDELAQSPREFKVFLVGDLDSLVNHFGAEHREELYTKIVRCSPVFEHAVNVNLNGLMWCFFDYLANDLDDLVKQFGEDRKEELYTKIIRHPLFFEGALNFNLDGLMWHFGNHKEFLYDQVACRENGFILNGLATQDLDSVMRHFGDDENKKHELYTKITGNKRVLSDLVRYNLDDLMRHFGQDYKEDLYEKIVHQKNTEHKCPFEADSVFQSALWFNLDGLKRHFDENEKNKDYEGFFYDQLINSMTMFIILQRYKLDSLMCNLGEHHKEPLFNRIINDSTTLYQLVTEDLDGLVDNFFEYKDQLLEGIQKNLPRYEQACNEKIAQRQIEEDQEEVTHDGVRAAGITFFQPRQTAEENEEAQRQHTLRGEPKVAQLENK